MRLVGPVLTSSFYLFVSSTCFGECVRLCLCLNPAGSFVICRWVEVSALPVLGIRMVQSKMSVVLPGCVLCTCAHGSGQSVQCASSVSCLAVYL